MMKQCYSYLIFYFLFEWCHGQNNLVRINTDRSSHVVMHSFSPPFERELFFWETGADAQVTKEYIQLTPATQSSTGFLWNKKKANMKDWEVVFEFKLKGRSDLGGDGFAFWYTDNTGLVGNVYGSSDFWSGLGVFFDTFNNDGKDKSPLISIAVNDGTQSFQADRDGAAEALGSCSFDIRNTEGKVSVRLRYTNEVLNLEIATSRDILGMPIYLQCAEVKNVLLSPEGFFGFSAHTGDLADIHNIYSMWVKDLSPIDTNLNDLKKRWEEEQDTLHQQHNDLSESEFHHVMLTKIRQTQEEINMVEGTTLSDAHNIQHLIELLDFLKLAFTSSFKEFAEKMNINIPNLSNMDIESVITKSFNTLRDEAYALKNARNDEKGNAISNQVTEITKFLNGIQGDLNTFRKDVESTKIQISQLNEKLISQTQMNSESNQQGNNGGWWIYIIISTITIPLGSVLMHVCQPKKDKYKSWD